LPLILPEVAVIVVLPASRAIVRPEELIVATVIFELLQLAVDVRLAVELSLKMPVAVNCRVRPAGTNGFGGVITIETNVTAVPDTLTETPIQADGISMAEVLPSIPSERVILLV
jgi:hypothetical protein